MGSCSSRDSVIVSNPVKKNTPTSTQIKSTKNSNKKEIYQNKIQNYDPKFRNMPEWEGERYRGEGIKRMRGYKCDLTIDILNKLREEFWNERISEKIVWRNLRQACLMDDVRAENVLKQAGFKTADGCINHLIDDITGDHFVIPNFCINDPYFEKEISNDKDCGEAMNSDKVIKIFVNDLYENKKTQIELPIISTGKDLKEKYLEKLKAEGDNSVSCITRILFGGTEIKEEHKLYQHKLDDDYHVLILKK